MARGQPFENVHLAGSGPIGSVVPEGWPVVKPTVRGRQVDSGLRIAVRESERVSRVDQTADVVSLLTVFLLAVRVGLGADLENEGAVALAYLLGVKTRVFVSVDR